MSTSPESTLTVTRSRLAGEVTISGAKNSALRLLAASLLTEDDVSLYNYPAGILDAQVHVQMLEALGKTCAVDGDFIRIAEPSSLNQTLNWEGRSIRNTLLILGALTARFGRGAVPLPGGCKLGERKYDIHVMLLEALGATVSEEGDMLVAEAKDGHLTGADIHLPIRSTGATENSIICGTLARGTTRVWNPHIRPEILDLIDLLRKMGAKIEVRGQESIIIHGTDSLKGCDHTVIPDNVEAFTWLIGSAITGGDVLMHNFPFEHLEIPLIHLRESGVEVFRHGETAIVRGKEVYPVEISTGPYPGINSDMQPLFAVLGAVAQGETRIVDLRFPGRYGYADELAKMGVRHEVKDNLLRIHGGTPLHGADVTALDLRAGAALMLAGMIADGETTIHNAWQIERGYCGLMAKLAALSINASRQS
ncbi:MAG: UDP-N-acetylglucosamine 1-carboxyvinyltransferase [Verrucomicrobiota bacterium JB024]|nr:UDP-N-acetylglucosamine 1-carboxyvinyltransferase [Verrucomicrobiota bacterium JB024]